MRYSTVVDCSSLSRRFLTHFVGDQGFNGCLRGGHHFLESEGHGNVSVGLGKAMVAFVPKAMKSISYTIPSLPYAADGFEAVMSIHLD